MLPKDLDDNDDYSFEYSPDGVPLDQMEYSSFKSKEDDFGDAIEKINKHMKKGIVIKACDILIRCKKVEMCFFCVRNHATSRSSSCQHKVDQPQLI